ncbi:malate dehydrogenase, mitochondrial-like [Scaptodrosophila lebanonensis]|uniref:Malate dehydrogenase n=1 Tax=Drosophila lebanonensis TaxID=7225 RepID=A0A6J2UFG9_DROLE|nr:malate dehydrogenase, mitochondrial-like [Scaptodrosophila lebanonensis]
MLSFAFNWTKLLQRRQPNLALLGFQNSVRNYKVTVVGASGGIGQPLSLLIKQNPLVRELALHDLANVAGVGADLSHVSTKATVESYAGDTELMDALRNAEVVVVSAGLPRKPGMTRDQLLGANGSIAIKVATAVSAACPDALLAFITNPLNSIVPIASEVLKAKKAFDPNRLFGITTLDLVRAKTFIADFMNINPQDVNIPVIGGHAGTTILPIFSQCKPDFQGRDEDVKSLTHRIQEAGTEVVKAKAGKGSATLSMAFSAAYFVNSLLRGLNGDENIIEYAYVASNVTDVPFFSTALLLGPSGITKNLGLPCLREDEEEALEKMKPVLMQSIEAGIDFATSILCEEMKKAVAK